MAVLLKIDSHPAFAGPTRRRAPLVLVHCGSPPPNRPPARQTLVMRWTAGTDGRLKAKWIVRGASDIVKIPDD